MEWMQIPMIVFALAFLIHGFPDIRIGTKDTFYNYYGDSPEEEEGDGE